MSRLRRIPIVALVGGAIFLVAIPLFALANGPSGAPDRLTGLEAVHAALSSSDVHPYVTEESYSSTRVMPLDAHSTRVTFYKGSRVVLEAAVEPDGSVSSFQALGPGYVRAGAPFAQKPVVLIVLSLFFLLLFAELPLRSLRNLDLVVLAASTLTLWILNQRLFELSIWVAIPILVYLILRCMYVGFGGERAPAKAGRSLVDALFESVHRSGDTSLVFAVGIAVITAVLICIPSGATGDVGLASLSGATQLVHGNLPYGHITTDVVHGDTYPFFAYLLYAPAAIVSPVYDAFDNTDGALYVACFALLAMAAAMYFAAKDHAGTRFALRNACAALVFPPVLVAASSGSNDLPTAMFVALSVATFARAAGSTLGMSLAAWTKVAPVLILPLWIARFRRAGLLRALVAMVAVTLVICAAMLGLDGPATLREMVRGIAFQAGRGSVLSVWTVLDAPTLQVVAQAAALAAAAAAAFAAWRSEELALDRRRVCALAAGIMLAVQFAANYWSYAYLPWVYPLIVVALLWPPATTRLSGSDGVSGPSTSHADSGA